MPSNHLTTANIIDTTQQWTVNGLLKTVPDSKQVLVQIEFTIQQALCLHVVDKQLWKLCHAGLDIDTDTITDNHPLHTI